MKRFGLSVALSLGLCVMFSARPLKATAVNLELLLLVDDSGSIDANEYNLQKQGYVDAFNSSSIYGLLAGTGIAVGYAEFSASGQQNLLVPFTQITDQASSQAFATAIGATSRPFSGNTAPGSAINWGVGELQNNGFEGDRIVIDVSGDGQQNNGANTLAAATSAHSLGITINGLPIGDTTLANWYQTNIVTPGGGFIVPASSFADFQTAIERKIGQEISDTTTPEPGTVGMMLLGLSGLIYFQRRRTARQ